MSMLELHDVVKVYGEGPTEVRALRGVNLSVDAGAMVAVMGPSGSGKSTLLTIAGSLEDPTSGEVLIDGAPLRQMSRNEKSRLRRRTVGYVFQDFNLRPGVAPHPGPLTAGTPSTASSTGSCPAGGFGSASRANPR